MILLVSQSFGSPEWHVVFSSNHFFPAGWSYCCFRKSYCEAWGLGKMGTVRFLQVEVWFPGWAGPAHGCGEEWAERGLDKIQTIHTEQWLELQRNSEGKGWPWWVSLTFSCGKRPVGECLLRQMSLILPCHCRFPRYVWAWGRGVAMRYLCGMGGGSELILSSLQTGVG